MGQQSKLSSKPNPNCGSGVGRDARVHWFKKTTVGYGLLLIDLQDGSSGLYAEAETGIKLYNQLRNIDEGFYCNDHRKCYQEMLSSSFHIQSRAETYAVEGYNSRIRHYLARFKRKGKCYGKAKHND